MYYVWCVTIGFYIMSCLCILTCCTSNAKKDLGNKEYIIIIIIMSVLGTPQPMWTMWRRKH
jgi:hypothetical protein